MALERLEFADMQKWGNLVKSWAKGTAPTPTSLDEFRAACVKADVGASIPSYITSVRIVQSANKEELLLRLPPKELVEDTEADLKAGGSYTLPKFYKVLFDNKEPTLPQDEDGKLKVHAMRIGDYTMSFCA